MNVWGSSAQKFEAPAQKADPQTQSKSSLTFLDPIRKGPYPTGYPNFDPIFENLR